MRGSGGRALDAGLVIISLNRMINSNFVEIILHEFIPSHIADRMESRDARPRCRHPTEQNLFYEKSQFWYFMPFWTRLWAVTWARAINLNSNGDRRMAKWKKRRENKSKIEKKLDCATEHTADNIKSCRARASCVRACVWEGAFVSNETAKQECKTLSILFRLLLLL